MTVITGVLCSDGVVLAADSAATLGLGGQYTSRQPTKKLLIIDDAVVVGASGAVGLNQRIHNEIEELWLTGRLSTAPPVQGVALNQKQIIENMNAITFGLPVPHATQIQPEPVTKPVEAGPVIAEAIRPHLLTELKAAAQAKDALGKDAALAPALCLTLAAMPINGAHCLIMFDAAGTPELCSESLPIVTIGGGAGIADPFMGFLRRVLWKDHQPTLQEGVFAAVWALQHCIETNTGGVAGPMQLVVLERHEGPHAWRARQLAQHELAQHEQAVTSAETQLRKFCSSVVIGAYVGEMDEEIAIPPRPSGAVEAAAPVPEPPPPVPTPDTPATPETPPS